MNALGALLAFALVGCSGSIELGRPAPIVPPPPPPGGSVAIEPNGEIIERSAPPIETVLTGLSQAQTTRVLVRQLAR